MLDAKAREFVEKHYAAKEHPWDGKPYSLENVDGWYERPDEIYYEHVLLFASELLYKVDIPQCHMWQDHLTTKDRFYMVGLPDFAGFMYLYFTNDGFWSENHFLALSRVINYDTGDYRHVLWFVNNTCSELPPYLIVERAVWLDTFEDIPLVTISNPLNMATV